MAVGTASETLTIAGLPFSAGGQNSSGSLGFVYSTAVDISNMRYSIGVGNTYITLYDGGDTTGFFQTHSDILADGVNKNRIFILVFITQANNPIAPVDSGAGPTGDNNVIN